MSFTLDVEKRTPKQESNHQLRKRDVIPAVYYHKHEDSVPLQVTLNKLTKALRSHEPVIKLSTGNLAIVKEVQTDPVSDKILHVSFEGVVKGEKFTQTIPLVLVHKENCPWKKEKLELKQVLGEIEVETTPANLPENVTVDVSDLDLEKVLTVKDLPSLEGVTYTEDGSTKVAHLAKEKIILEEEETSTEEATVETTESESTTDKKED